MASSRPVIDTAPVRPMMTSEGSLRPSSAAFILPTPSSSEISCVFACPKACGSNVSSIVRPPAPAPSNSCPARDPPHLFAELRQRDQCNVGIAQYRQRGHRTTEHADFEAEVFGDADRG